MNAIDYQKLAFQIKEWGQSLGFQKLAIATLDLGSDEKHLLQWIEAGFHGEMDYMIRHGMRRSRPAALIPGTLSVISARMNYFPQHAADPKKILGNPNLGYIARYALGRDYHPIMRSRLKRLAERIHEAIGPFDYRVFSDSAPVLEKALAASSGLGWIGKNTNLIARDAGSWFFLGEIYTSLPLPTDPPQLGHCGRCTKCIDACPTGALIAPYRLDARRCIAYLTLESFGSIPRELATRMGNRIVGCDDCQLVCPWNQEAPKTSEKDFFPRHGLDALSLTSARGWTEIEFLEHAKGSPLRRLGYNRFLRNVEVALKNVAC